MIEVNKLNARMQTAFPYYIIFEHAHSNTFYVHLIKIYTFYKLQPDSQIGKHHLIGQREN